jgi:hypothetical protein
LLSVHQRLIFLSGEMQGHSGMWRDFVELGVKHAWRIAVIRALLTPSKTSND